MARRESAERGGSRDQRGSGESTPKYMIPVGVQRYQRSSASTSFGSSSVLVYGSQVGEELEEPKEAEPRVTVDQGEPIGDEQEEENGEEQPLLADDVILDAPPLSRSSTRSTLYWTPPLPPKETDL